MTNFSILFSSDSRKSEEWIIKFVFSRNAQKRKMKKHLMWISIQCETEKTAKINMKSSVSMEQNKKETNELVKMNIHVLSFPPFSSNLVSYSFSISLERSISIYFLCTLGMIEIYEMQNAFQSTADNQNGNKFSFSK